MEGKDYHRMHLACGGKHTILIIILFELNSTETELHIRPLWKQTGCPCDTNLFIPFHARLIPHYICFVIINHNSKINPTGLCGSHPRLRDWESTSLPLHTYNKGRDNAEAPHDHVASVFATAMLQSQMETSVKCCPCCWAYGTMPFTIRFCIHSSELKQSSTY